MKARVWRTASLVLVLGWCLAPAADARGPQEREKVAAPTAKAAGIAVEVDAKTGRIKGISKAQVRQVRESMGKLFKPVPVEITNRPGGGISMRFNDKGMFAHVMVAHVNDDGTIATGCFSDAATAIAFVESKESVPVKE